MTTRILIVDDEPANLFLLESLLVPEGYEVVSATNGREALPIVAGGSVDLVLLDVMMPELDGISACRAIRNDLQELLLPVVLVTALHDHVSRTRGKAAGADDFITKPIYEEELLARIESLLRVRAYQAELDAERRKTQRAARRWNLVARVAELAETAQTGGDLCRAIQLALGAELRIETPEIVAGQRERTGALAISLGQQHGTLLVKPEKGFTFDDDDREVLLALVPHVSNAIARLSLSDARETLEAARQQLTSLVLHDLKNPLTVVQMNLDFARDGLKKSRRPDEVAESLEDAARGADQLLHLLLDLLDIGLIEDGRLPFVPQLGDVREIAGAAAEAFRPILAAQGATLLFEADATVRPVQLDAKLLSRALQNLLANAARYTEGIVEVTVRQGPDHVTLSVANDGPPIAADMKAAIFKKFGQLTDGQTAHNRGLGLYLCSLVAERHGGAISVRDRDSGGACFDLTLPSAQSAARVAGRRGD